MRVFVLCAGRCGSMTWAKACFHITNFSSGHETHADVITNRLSYPDQHIEVDNRLSWFLGSLDKRYGNEPVYVHLTRDENEVADSYAKRFTGKVSIMRAFGRDILQRHHLPESDHRKIALLYTRTVTENIQLFLKDKSKVIQASLPDLKPSFNAMWHAISAEGDQNAANKELLKHYNQSADK